MIKYSDKNKNNTMFSRNRRKFSRSKKRHKNRNVKNENDDSSDSDENSNPDIKIQKNHIYFWCDVTKKSALDLTIKLNTVFNDVRSLTLSTDDSTPMYIHLNSYGGDTDAAIGVIDTMSSLKEQGANIITIVEGNASSAATFISMAGSERRIRPNATMRIHQFSTGIMGKKAEIDDEHGNLGKLESIILDFYKQHTSQTKSQLKKIMSREIDFTASECIERGFVDSIQY